jgi:hypothetical protein
VLLKRRTKGHVAAHDACLLSENPATVQATLDEFALHREGPEKSCGQALAYLVPQRFMANEARFPPGKQCYGCRFARQSSVQAISWQFCYFSKRDLGRQKSKTHLECELTKLPKPISVSFVSPRSLTFERIAGSDGIPLHDHADGGSHSHDD